jgi:hypothetical protein
VNAILIRRWYLHFELMQPSLDEAVGKLVAQADSGLR